MHPGDWHPGTWVAGHGAALLGLSGPDLAGDSLEKFLLISFISPGLFSFPSLLPRSEGNPSLPPHFSSQMLLFANLLIHLILGVSALEGPGYHNGREKIQVAERRETGRGEIC